MEGPPLVGNAEAPVPGPQEADTEGKAALEKAEKGAHLVGNAEALVTGLLGEASMVKEGAKVEGPPLVGNAEAQVTGPQEADTEGKAAQEKAEKGAHLAEDTAEKEGAKVDSALETAADTGEKAALEKAEKDAHLVGNAEGQVTGLLGEASMVKEGAKVEGPPLVGNAEALVTGPQAGHTAER